MLYMKNISGSNLTINSLRIFDMAAQAVIELTQNYSKSDISNADDLITNIANGNVEISDEYITLDVAAAIKTIVGEISPTQVDAQGRWYVRTDSRPKDWDILFTGAADDLTGKIIGGGKDFVWDFSNNNDLDLNPPRGFKKKVIKFQFLDQIKMKEGTIYFYDAPKGCYIDFYIICPKDQYYNKKTIDSREVVTKTITQAVEDVRTIHWVVKYHITGSAPAGIELNTEAAADEELPSYVFWQVEITTPESDNVSYGHFSLEVYRQRTIYFEGI